MATKELTVREFQKYIAKRYAKYDRKRGTPETFLWFMEEIGELATAFAGRTDRQNLREEFADVLAWLCTLANINDVDLADAVKMKYLTPKRPKGHK
jgi:NTP pyrophosphatase (non-canonical NTP hydrolase)